MSVMHIAWRNPVLGTS